MRPSHPLLSALVFLGACTAGPNYEGPPAVGSAGKPEFLRGGSDVDAQAPVLANWWTLLNDPVLDSLVAQGLAGNPGLDAARARIDQARAALRKERVSGLPALAGQGTTVQAKIPGLDRRDGAAESGAPDPIAERDSLSIYNLGLNASWEIDFAGGQTRRIEAANAQADAVVADAQDAQVQLTAEIARAYVALREAQSRRELLGQERILQQQTLELTYQRYTQGALPLFPVGAANSELELLKSRIAEAEADVAVFSDTLAALTGQPPGNLDNVLAQRSEIPLPPQHVAVADPAALIARRPDIRAAERALAAANARIGVAEAARFPKLSLMGILGLGGSHPGDILDLGNVSAIALPRLQWNLFDLGRTAAAIDQSRAGRHEAEARYREAVLRALQDAEQSLARFGQQRTNAAALAQISFQAVTAAKLNRQRYEAGVISRGDLNTSLRQREQAKANLDRATAAMTNSWIAIQKSLGLGWTDAPYKPPVRSAEND